ncbi:hypothetical protein D3C87_1463450 [compost metagenome]
MATGTAQTAKAGRTYRVGGDGWWGISDTVLILVSDRVVVALKDEAFVHVDVFRDGKLLGSKKINLCFFDEDFELVQECEHTESPCTEQAPPQTMSPFTTWAK